MIRILVILLALAPSVVAHADEASARKLFGDGERAYNLGQFDKAVELFAKAYEEWPEPAFLFNLAQTYRQMGDCKQAGFFYKRFIALKDQDTKKPLKPELRAEVEKRITELEECVKRELASKPPTSLDNGQNNNTTTTTTTTKPNTTNASTTNTAAAGGDVDGDGEDDGEGDDGEGEDDGSITKQADGQPKLMQVRVGLGAGIVTAGDLGTTQFAGTIVGGYPLTLNPKLQLELGAALSFVPVPYTTTMDESGSAGVFGILANVGPSYTVMPKLAVRADLGVGVLVFSGLGLDGNPFTVDGNPATGALSSLMVRAAVSGDYAVTPNVVVTVTPLAFAYSPAPTGFDESISSVTTLSFLAGVAYRR